MKPSRTYKILVVDDHFVVRAGIRDILSHEPDFIVAGEAANGREAVIARVDGLVLHVRASA